MVWTARPPRAFFVFGVALFFLASAALWADGPHIALTYAAEKLAALEEGKEDPQALYREAITRHGGTIVVIGQGWPEAQVDAALAQVQGVLLPGGIDVDPKFYGEEQHEKLEKTDAELDQLEFHMLDYAKAHRLPVLGICRGHQLMNVYYGGSLIQDIPTEHTGEVTVKHRYPKESAERKMHIIRLSAGSLLEQLAGGPRLEVNTYHHQAVKRLAPGFSITAASEDGIVEGIARPGPVFIVGVQFHPEKMVKEEPRLDALFTAFLEAAKGAEKHE